METIIEEGAGQAVRLPPQKNTNFVPVLAALLEVLLQEPLEALQPVLPEALLQEPLEVLPEPEAVLHKPYYSSPFTNKTNLTSNIIPIYTEIFTIIPKKIIMVNILFWKISSIFPSLTGYKTAGGASICSAGSLQASSQSLMETE